MRSLPTKFCYGRDRISSARGGCGPGLGVAGGMTTGRRRHRARALGAGIGLWALGLAAVRGFGTDEFAACMINTRYPLHASSIAGADAWISAGLR